jgi:zinc protease
MRWLGLVVLVACGAAQSAAPMTNALPLPSITRAGVLGNGLRYVVIHAPTPAITIRIAAGSLGDADGRTGAAYVLPRVLAAHVAGERAMSAYTVPDETFVFSTGERADYRRDLPAFRAWLDEPISAATVARIRATAPEPQRDPFGASALALEAEISGTRLAERPVFGLDADRVHLTAADLAAFRTRWYVPRAITIVVQGPWAPSDVVDEIERDFGALPDGALPIVAPLRTGPHDAIRVGEADAHSPDRITLTFLRKRLPLATRGDLRAAATRAILDELLRRRLAGGWNVDTNRHPLEVAQTNLVGWALTHDLTTLRIEVETRVDPLLVIAHLASELEQIHLHGFDHAELESARAWAGDTAVEACVGCDSVGNAARGDWPMTSGEQAKAVHAMAMTVTADEVNAMSTEEIDVAEMSAVVECKHPDVTPAQVRAAIAGGRAQAATAQSLIIPQPTAGPIVAETTDGPATRLRLGNGATVVVHPTSDAWVTLHAWSPGGALAAADDDIAAMARVPSLLRAAGLGELDGLATELLLRRARLFVEITIGLRRENVDVSGPPSSLEALFSVMRLAMTSSRVDGVSALAATLDRPESVEPGDSAELLPRRTRADLGLLPDETPTPAHAVELFRQRFGNAGDFTFELSGPVNIATVRPLIARYLASLPDDGRREAEAPLATIDHAVRIHRQQCGSSLVWTARGPSARSFDPGYLLAAAAKGFGDLHLDVVRRDDAGYVITAPGGSLWFTYKDVGCTATDELTLRKRLEALRTRTWRPVDLVLLRSLYAKPNDEWHAMGFTLDDVRAVLATMLPGPNVVTIDGS